MKVILRPRNFEYTLKRFFFRDQSVLVSCMVARKMVYTFVLTIVALMHCGGSCALFGAVGLIMGHNGTTANSALGGIYRSNRLSLA